MEILLSFLVAFAFSFVGTIPPGTINLSIVQLGLDRKIRVAWRFAVAAAIIEYPYAWLAITLEDVITTSANITGRFQLLTGVVMIALGVFSLWTAQKPSSMAVRFNASGFRRGVILALLNPQALPYWLAITAYLKSIGWVDLSNGTEIHAYLLGVSLGTLTLLIIVAHLAEFAVKHFRQNTLLKKIPGYTLVILGAYSIAEFFLR